MQALAEIQVIPLGVGVSVRRQVKRAQAIIEESGLRYEAHAYGTNVEGELDRIFATITRIHESLHSEGTPRIATALKIGTRTDKVPTLAGKRL